MAQAFQVGQTITSDNGFSTGYKPGVSQWNIGGGQQANVKGYRNEGGVDYYDLDFSASGGGTGWARADGLKLFQAPAAQAPAPAPGGGGSLQGPRYDLAQQQAAEQQAKKNEYITYLKGLPTVSDRFNTFRAETGIDEQQATMDAIMRQILGTTSDLKNLGDDVNDRTGEYLMTAAQRRAVTQRESQPMQKFLSDLTQNYGLQQVGMEGKTNMLNMLMQNSLADDERGAKPYEIDMSETRAIADAIMQAFSGDQSTRDSQAADALSRAHELAMQQKGFENDKALASFTNSLPSKSGGGSSGGGSSAKTVTAKAQADQLWNSLINDSKYNSEYDIWKAITSQGAGLDPTVYNDLIARHKQLKAQVGLDGAIRAGAQNGSRYGTGGSSFAM